MAEPQKLNHRTIQNAAIPYGPSQNPISESPSLNAGSDLLAVIDSLTDSGWIERRPGWSAKFVSSDSTSFTNCTRLFAWRRWAGNFYVMASNVSGGTSKVYYSLTPFSASFTELSAVSSSSSEPYEFVASGNYLYMSNGTNSYKWDGTTVSGWGITGPSGQPHASTRFSNMPGDISSALGYKYVYCYYNSTTGHFSSPSLATNSTGASTSMTGYFIGKYSADTQVDQIWVFRTSDGGDGVFYGISGTGAVFSNNPVLTGIGQPVMSGTGTYTDSEITSSGTYGGAGAPEYTVVIDTTGTPDKFKWSTDNGATWQATGVSITGSAQSLNNGISITFAHTTGHTVGDRWDFQNWRNADQTIDEGLSTTKVFSPDSVNDKPNAMNGITLYANRIWGFKNDTVYYSGFEEVQNGVEEECFPPGNTFVFADEVMGLAPVENGLLVFTGSKTYKISGDSLDTFRRDNLFSRVGMRNRGTITPIGKSVAWLDSDNTIRISDGLTQNEISKPIRADLSASAAIANFQQYASMCYHTDGKRRLLMFMDNVSSKIRVYDIDMDIWMPPWSIQGTCIASLETAVGTYQLLLARASDKILVNSGTVYQDLLSGSLTSYAASMVTQLISLTDNPTPGFVSTVEYVGIEYAGAFLAPATVEILPDEDPASGSFTAITANAQTPALRTQGSGLKEVWYYARTPGARRASLKLTWAASATNFKLYGFDFAGYEIQR